VISETLKKVGGGITEVNSPKGNEGGDKDQEKRTQTNKAFRVKRRHGASLRAKYILRK